MYFVWEAKPTCDQKFSPLDIFHYSFKIILLNNYLCSVSTWIKSNKIIIHTYVKSIKMGFNRRNNKSHFALVFTEMQISRSKFKKYKQNKMSKILYCFLMSDTSNARREWVLMQFPYFSISHIPNKSSLWGVGDTPPHTQGKKSETVTPKGCFHHHIRSTQTDSCHQL